MSLNCPCCRTRLRVQARLSVGRIARCPECRSEIVIVEDGDTWRVETPTSQPTPHGLPNTRNKLPTDPGQAAAELPGEHTGQASAVPWLQRAFQLAGQPLVIVAAGACALAAISLYWFFGSAPLVPAARLAFKAPPAAIVEQVAASSPLDETPRGPAEPATAEASTAGDDSPSATLEPLRKDASVAFEPPGDAFTPSTPAPSNSRDDEPLIPEFADDPDNTLRPFDIAASLRQNIESYQIAQPRKLAELLPELAELVGVPIRFAGPEPASAHPELKTLVQVQLRNTTVGAILEAVCNDAGLAYRVEDGHVQLVPRN